MNIALVAPLLSLATFYPLNDGHVNETIITNILLAPDENSEYRATPLTRDEYFAVPGTSDQQRHLVEARPEGGVNTTVDMQVPPQPEEGDTPQGGFYSGTNGQSGVQATSVEIFPSAALQGITAGRKTTEVASVSGTDLVGHEGLDLCLSRLERDNSERCEGRKGKKKEVLRKEKYPGHTHHTSRSLTEAVEPVHAEMVAARLLELARGRAADPPSELIALSPLRGGLAIVAGIDGMNDPDDRMLGLLPPLQGGVHMLTSLEDVEERLDEETGCNTYDGQPEEPTGGRNYPVPRVGGEEGVIRTRELSAARNSDISETVDRHTTSSRGVKQFRDELVDDETGGEPDKKRLKKAH